MIIGTAASPGIAIGKVLILQKEDILVEKRIIEDVDAEKDKFLKAIHHAKDDLTQIKEKTMKEIGQEKAQIFEAHLMVLQDPELMSATMNMVRDERVNIEYAFLQITHQFVSIFESMENEYMRERAADIKDVSERILRYLTGTKVTDLSILNEEVIIVAADLTPSETASMDKDKVLGFLTNVGGRTSHTAIMARTLEIPAIVGLKNITKVLKSGDRVIINGHNGEVVIQPDEEQIKEYTKIQQEDIARKKELETLKGQASITLDNKKVELAGNIGTPNDIKGLKKNDAEGVGLFRTEFLYMDRNSFPSEDEQFYAYQKVLEQMGNKSVVIRTLDIGGDKELSYLNIEKEANPFLGYRAIRLCLDKKDIFKTQLRALLRASVYGNLKIMFPMISSLEELLEAKKVYHEVKAELDDEGIEYSNTIQVGMMIEVPSAAFISDVLAKHVDFFSIGTNDLIQYTSAVDRMNEKINHLYNPYHPAVLRIIKMVIDNGHKEGIWVGMCGEMAGDLKLIPVLLGLGLDEFSMSALSILPARKLIRSLNYEEMVKVAERVLSLDSASDIETFISTHVNL